MTAYYNEIDPFAAAWLRELIKAGLIAPGTVDERSIEDVRPEELMQYTQCHFFAGIGVWSYALRQAGWPDDKPVWTGSCPCQPFSAAGKGAGFDDERHLWPAFHWLTAQCQPPVVFGEQVASKAAESWIDLVQTDLEAMGYSCAAVAFPSAGVGSPHIRDRLYWVADSELQQRQGGQSSVSNDNETRGRQQDTAAPAGLCGDSRLADAGSQRRQQDAGGAPSHEKAHGAAGRDEQQSNGDHLSAGDVQVYRDCATRPTNGFWRNADWLFCRDGKFRPVEPGTFPLVNGTTNRVGRLRGYGNAINAQAAQAFIESYMGV